MRQLVVFLIIILLVPACGSKNKVPKDILSKQQMEDVMWDLIKGGEFLEIYLLPKDTSLDKGAKAAEWYDHIFQLHKVTRPQFEKSYTWYQNHPVVMKEVLDSLANKPTQGFRPPGQQTPADSLASKDSTKRSIDSLQKPKPIFLPGQHKPFINTDSIRKARAKKLQKLPV